MSRYQPPFSITPSVLNLVVEIGELLGHWSAKRGQASPLLRKENRIRTIQASLAIEHNSLSMEQVTALLEGKAMDDAIRFAHAAAAIAVTRKGAQPSVPWRKEIDEFLSQQG